MNLHGIKAVLLHMRGKKPGELLSNLEKWRYIHFLSIHGTLLIKVNIVLIFPIREP